MTKDFKRKPEEKLSELDQAFNEFRNKAAVIIKTAASKAIVEANAAADKLRREMVELKRERNISVQQETKARVEVEKELHAARARIAELEERLRKCGDMQTALEAGAAS